MLVEFNGNTPKVGDEVFIAPDAWLIGDVTVGNSVSIFFHAVLRGDLMPIRIGNGTNIQEHCMLHTTYGRTPTIIGDKCTIGHRAIIHGCTIGNNTLVGMGSIILDGAIVGDECLIGAGAVVPETKVIPPRSLVLGVPGKIVRTLTEDEVSVLVRSAEGYIEAGKKYQDIDFL